MTTAEDAGRRVVVVGASLAGVRTVQALRRRRSTADIVLVASEPGTVDGVAADRPPLSKTFLVDGSLTAAPLATAADLAGLGVQLVHAHATDLDLNARRVGLDAGDALPFDSLVIATGSKPRTLPGVKPRQGVHVLRTAADAAAVRQECREGGRVVVVGGGFIGAEVAWTLNAAGRQVSVVEPLPTLMVRGLGPELGQVFSRRHTAAGIDLRTGVGVMGLEGAVRVEGVRLTDGSYIPADVVVLGLGTMPETSWLIGSGLDLRDGVACDERLSAVGAEDVYVVGDAARWYHPRYGENLRVEHWTNAVETATVVAANLTGTQSRHDSLPYVWSDQLGGRLQVFGRVRPQDELRVVEGEIDGNFVAVCGGDGVMQAAVGFGMVKPFMQFRRMLATGAAWDENLASS